MSQVSKVDKALDLIEVDGYPETGYYVSSDSIEKAKQALLSIILEALPEKKDGLGEVWVDPNDHSLGKTYSCRACGDFDSCDCMGFNEALTEVKEALNVVFGVEG